MDEISLLDKRIDRQKENEGRGTNMCSRRPLCLSGLRFDTQFTSEKTLDILSLQQKGCPIPEMELLNEGGFGGNERAKNIQRLFKL